MAAAPWVAVDSAMRVLTDHYVGRVSVDYLARGDEQNATSASEIAAAVPDVVYAEPIIWAGVKLNVSGSTRWVSANWINQSTFPQAAAHLGLNWPTSLASGGLVVHDSLRAAGLTVGQTVTLENRVEEEDPNGTLISSEVWALTRRIDGFYNVTPSREFSTRSGLTAGITPPPGAGEFREPATVDLILEGTATFLTDSDLQDSKSALNLPFALPAQLLIWLNRGALLSPYDPDGTAARVLRVRTLLEDALEPYNFYPEYSGDLEHAVQSLAFHVRLLRAWFLPFTIPTIAMAILLSRVGFDVGLSGRRRELAVLRARGVSARGVRGFLLVEMTVVSLLAAVVGLGIALLLSRLLLALPIFSGSVVGASPATVTPDIAVAPITLALIVGFALLLGWLASRRGFKLALPKDIVSGFRVYHREEASIPHRASRDFLLVAVGGAGLALVFLTGFMGEYSDLAPWLGIPTTALAAVAPILLAIGLARYLTRGTTRVYRALARLLRPFLGKAEGLVEKSIARAPRRASNIAMIVTFAVAFLVAMPVITASAEAYLNEQALWRTPSDIVVDANQGDLRASGRIKAIPGVAEATSILEVAWSSLGTMSSQGTTWIFNASSYLRTVPWLEPRHLLGVDPNWLMQELGRGDAVAANPQYQQVTGLRPGDPVQVRLPISTSNGTVVITFTGRLAASVPTLPGMSGDRSVSQLYLDSSSVAPDTLTRIPGRVKFLVKLSPDATLATVVASILALFPQGTANVRTSEEALGVDVTNDPVQVGVATLRYLAIQSQLAALLMVLGIGLLVFTAATARRNELVTLVARGFGRDLVARLVMAEGWIVALLGVLLGTVTGLLVAPSVLVIASSYLPIPIPFVVPWTALVPVFVVAAGIWVASFLGAVSVRRMDAARVLKMRGG